MVSSVFFYGLMRNRKKSMKFHGLYDDFPGTTLRISPRYIFLPNDPQTEFYVDS